MLVPAAFHKGLSPWPSSVQVEAGFTLIELLITVSIMAVVAAVTIPNFNSFVDNQNLRQAQEQVKNGIRDAQNRAVSGVDSNSSFTFWGIRFNADSDFYEIGKVTAASPGQSECNAMTAESRSGPLQGDAKFSNASQDRCLFFEMISGDVVSTHSAVSGEYWNCIENQAGTTYFGINVNSAGRVKNSGSTGSCPN